MTTVVEGATTIATYTHNALGERTIKNTNGTITHFHYDENHQLIAESDGNGKVQRIYIYLGDMLITRVDVTDDPPPTGGVCPLMAAATSFQTADLAVLREFRDHTLAPFTVANYQVGQ